MVGSLTCLLLDIPDSFFRLDVLEVRINSTVRYCLDFLSDCMLEAIVCMVMFDFNPVRPGVSLKHLLWFYRIFWRQSLLQVHVGQITVVIQEDCFHAVTLLGGLALELGYESRSDIFHLVN